MQHTSETLVLRESRLSFETLRLKSVSVLGFLSRPIHVSAAYVRV